MLGGGGARPLWSPMDIAAFVIAVIALVMVLVLYIYIIKES